MSRNWRNIILLFISTFKKVSRDGKNVILLFISTFEKGLEMGETLFSYLEALLKKVWNGRNGILLFIGTLEKCHGFSYFWTLFVASPVSDISCALIGSPIRYKNVT